MRTVVLVGQFQDGKSTLINCLLGGIYALEGVGTRTTACRTVYAYSSEAVTYEKVALGGQRTALREDVSPTVTCIGGGAHIEAKVPSPILKEMTLVDVPGWGVDESDNRQVEIALREGNLVVLLSQDRQFSQKDRDFLSLLRKSGNYFCVLMNMRNARDPLQEGVHSELCGAIAAALKREHLDGQFIRYPSETGICAVNLLWAKYGRHLLDAPKTGREKIQAGVALNAWRNLVDEPSVPPDHAQLLEASGFAQWQVFLRAAVMLADRLPPPPQAEDPVRRSATLLCKALEAVAERT